MQTNSDTRATVEAIEKMSGITVANDVSEDVKAYIDTANIKVLGAALNADDGVSNVGLKITKEADVATLDSKYKNAIPLLDLQFRLQLQSLFQGESISVNLLFYI